VLCTYDFQNYFIQHKMQSIGSVQIASNRYDLMIEPCDAFQLYCADKEPSADPRKYLILINPVGGKGKAVHIFHSQIQLLFDLAGAEYQVLITGMCCVSVHTHTLVCVCVYVCVYVVQHYIS